MVNIQLNDFMTTTGPYLPKTVGTSIVVKGVSQAECLRGHSLSKIGFPITRCVVFQEPSVVMYIGSAGGTCYGSGVVSRWICGRVSATYRLYLPTEGKQD